MDPDLLPVSEHLPSIPFPTVNFNQINKGKSAIIVKNKNKKWKKRHDQQLHFEYWCLGSVVKLWKEDSNVTCLSALCGVLVQILFHEDGSVKGVATNDVGIQKDGAPKVHTISLSDQLVLASCGCMCVCEWGGGGGGGGLRGVFVVLYCVCVCLGGWVCGGVCHSVLCVCECLGGWVCGCVCLSVFNCEVGVGVCVCSVCCVCMFVLVHLHIQFCVYLWIYVFRFLCSVCMCGIYIYFTFNLVWAVVFGDLYVQFSVLYKTDTIQYNFIAKC